MYKHYSALVGLFLIFSCSLLAQDAMTGACPQEEEACNRHETVDCRRLADKKAFILNRVALTEEEQKLVWPIFEAFELQNRTQNQINRLTRDSEKTTQEDYESALRIMVDAENREGSNLQKYISDLEKVLSPEKTYKFLEASRHFKIHLIRQMQEGHRSKGKNKR